MPEKMLKGFHFFKATDTPNETHLLPHSQSQGYPRYQKTFFFKPQDASYHHLIKAGTTGIALTQK